MKIFIAIFILLLVAIYLGLFLKSTEVYRDSGSSKKKVVESFAGIKSTEIKDTVISKFLSKHGIKESESWVKIRSYRGGLIREMIFERNPRFQFESSLDRLDNWISNIQYSKKINESDKEKIIMPIIIKIMECLKNDDLKGLNLIVDNFDQIVE